MTGELKAFFSPSLVRRLAREIGAVHPAFDEPAFVARASRGLGALELLDRARHIARALAAHLPRDYPAALDVLLRSLGPEHPGDELIGAGMAPFFYLPHLDFVAGHGLDDFDLSLDAQREMTKRCSAEWSIRAFIARDPARTFARLVEWARDPNPHVRRLVSEGTRVRLPWGRRVAWLDENPERILALLETLRDDPTTLVRRSVANNLNDLGKLHPQFLIDTCRRWLGDATPERRALVEHALRSAVKRGDAAALQLLGFGARVRAAIDAVRFEPRCVAIGGRVAIRFVLRSTARTTQHVLVDVRVHLVKANGTTPKVFKLDRIALPARGTVELRQTVSLAVHTTRKPYPGRHAVDVLLNGVAVPIGAFEVVA